MTKSLADLITLAGETNEFNQYNGYAKAYEDGYGIQYLAMKDLLEVGENCEALEELRHGHAADEIYLSWPPTPASLATEFASGEEATAHFRATTRGKPEGYIIEKLDAIIRSMGTLFEVARVHGVDVSVIEDHLVGKIEYNAQRADTARSGVKSF